MLWHIGWVGLLIGGVSLGIGLWGWRTGNPAWQSMVFTTLALLQMAHVLAIRIERGSVLGRAFLVEPSPAGERAVNPWAAARRVVHPVAAGRVFNCATQLG
jgi:magnesium-transporting ATPase (P-type)